MSEKCDCGFVPGFHDQQLAQLRRERDELAHQLEAARASMEELAEECAGGGSGVHWVAHSIRRRMGRVATIRALTPPTDLPKP